MTSGQEMEWVNSHNPETPMGIFQWRSKQGAFHCLCPRNQLPTTLSLSSKKLKINLKTISRNFSIFRTAMTYTVLLYGAYYKCYCYCECWPSVVIHSSLPPLFKGSNICTKVSKIFTGSLKQFWPDALPATTNYSYGLPAGAEGGFTGWKSIS